MTDFTIKCRYCNDAGIVHPIDETGKPDYSKTIPCRECADQERVRLSLGVSSMNKTFETFLPEKGTANALKAARLVASLRTRWKMLLIYGPWGNGKTHLLEAITIELWKRGLFARIQTFPDLMGRLKDTFERDKGQREQTFNDIIKSVYTLPYLLVDDVGSAGSFTPFSLAQLERVVLYRYRENLFTVLTTNLDISKIPEFIISRFSDAEKARLVLNNGEDFRPKINRARSKA
jgi:DNA replication protein DnaC